MSELAQYSSKKFELSNDDRMVEFRKLAPTFGQADEQTKKFREECCALGFSVVFRSGLSRQETLDILRSPETLKILNSHS